MKLRYLPILAALGFFATSCATQTASQGSSTDDIYFSSGDAIPAEVITTTTTTTTSSDDYSTYPGNTESYEYSEPRQDDYDYRAGEEFPTTSDEYYDEDGNTYIVNNYYDDNDYDDYYYTSNLYRYYYPNYGFGFYSHCYSPYYYDPFWGPSYGWNVGFGWGYPYNYGNCYPGYYGYYDPWFNPYYGYGWGNGWGYGYGGYYGSYWNGYNNGYYNGYYDGYYDGYYGGNGYGNDYYGYSDDYYYGPNTSTGSNTNTGTSSVGLLTAGYDKVGTTPEGNHILTDKGALVVDKSNVNTTAGAEDIASNIGKPETTSVKGDVVKSDAVTAGNYVKPGAVAIEQPAVAGAGVVKEGSGVKVIKYYNAESNNAIASTNTTGSTVTKADRDIRSGYNTVSKPVKSNSSSSSSVDSKPSNGTYRPAGDQSRQQGTVNQSNEKAPVRTYEQPKQNTNSGKSNTYQQPKSNSGSKTYEAPKTSRPTYEAPKSSGSSGSSKGSYNSGSSPSRSSGSSSGGSRPSSGSSPKRSGGK